MKNSPTWNDRSRTRIIITGDIKTKDPLAPSWRVAELQIRAVSADRTLRKKRKKTNLGQDTFLRKILFETSKIRLVDATYKETTIYPVSTLVLRFKFR